MGKMRSRRFPFPHAFGRNQGIAGDAVEHIEHLREAGFRTRAPSSGMPDSKMGADVWCVGQVRHGAIHRRQAKTLPPRRGEMFVEIRNLGWVQFDESFIFELLTGLAKGTLGQ